MLEDALGGIVGFLALLGAVALFLRTTRSVLGFVLRAAEIASAAGMAEASARRGDLTSLSEAQDALAAARSRRAWSAAIALGWASWLVVPLALGWVPEAWALASPLWIVPGGSVRPARPGQG